MLAVLKQQGLVDPDIFISKTNELAKQLRKLRLEKAHLLAYSHGEYFALGKKLGKFGYSVKKASTIQHEKAMQKKQHSTRNSTKNRDKSLTKHHKKETK